MKNEAVELAGDVRRALRRLARAPIFSLTAVLLLALGVASATAMFSLCDAVLLRPLPGVADNAGLVHLERWDGKRLIGDLSFPDFLDYRVQSRAFSLLTGTSGDQMTIAIGGFSRQARGELTAPGYFEALGVRPELGRLLAPADSQPRQNHVLVLSDHWWRSEFGASPGVLGQAVEVNRAPMTIVGVAALGFAGTSLAAPTAFWVPISAYAYLDPQGGCLTSRACAWITAFGRLAPGVSLPQAQAEMATLAARVGAAHGVPARRLRVAAGLGSWSVERASQAQFLGLLLAGTLLLLAMASSSVGALFLARAGARQLELATQLALGAGRGRVVRQVLTEGCLLAAAGAGIGIAATPPLLRGLLALAPLAPRNLALGLDWRLAAFAAAATAGCALAMSLAPALLSARIGIAEGLRHGRNASARHATQRAMLAFQIAIALLLLIAAGLAAGTLRAATAGAVPAGAEHTLIALVDPGSQGYSRSQSVVFLRRLRARAAAQPGIGSVVLAACMPPTSCNRGAVFVAGSEPPPALVRAREFSWPVRPDINWVGPGFFHMFGLPLLAGRDFGAGDRLGGTPVCVINQSLARRLWPHEPALGQRIAWPAYARLANQHVFTVIGIVADRRTSSLLAAAPEQMYVAAAQVPFPRMWIAIHGRPSAAALAAGLRRQVATLDPAVPVESVRTLAEQVRRSVWQPLAIADLAGGFGLLAALLAASGLFGTVAQFVEERRKELGIRLALGATPRRLRQQALRSVLAPIGAGLGLGALAAAVAAPAMAPWLYGVRPGDVRAWAGAALLLAAAALAASWLAACRITRLDPAAALRRD